MNPKYLRIASDLHIESVAVDATTIDHFLPSDERDSESVLLLAGDISSQPQKLEQFLSAIESRFMRVLMVPGNHEYYEHEFAELNLELAELESQLKQTNISGGETRVVTFGNVRVIFATMWADGGASLAERAGVGHYLNDFQYIRKGFRLFNVSDMSTLNAIHRNEIENHLKIPFDGKTVVMTHHLPSYSLCAQRFGTDYNGGFASHCDRLFYESFAPNIWVHGHTHDTLDCEIGSTRIICNPAGYKRERGSSFNHFTPLFIQI